MKNRIKNLEAEESKQLNSEVSDNLVCSIQGGISNTDKIDHLHQGIALSLESDMDKYSEKLQKNSLWHKIQRISSLPPYLCIQVKND